MPSPFPGMDPFIEGQVWEDFHHRFIDEIAVAITPSLRPRYVARVTLTLPIPVEMRRAFLTIRDRDNLQVVAEIELLSPWNKRPGSDGVREYARKRETVLRSSAHLVELDLLRGGQRLETLEKLPAGDYYALVSRERRRPKVEVYAWSLRQPLPTVPIPLAGSDPDVPLDLQAVFTSVYDRAGYDYSLDYTRPVEPPLSEEDAAWAREVLAKAHESRHA